MTRIRIGSMIMLSIVVLLSITGCCTRPHGVIAVREEGHRFETGLPLSNASADSILDFISRGGVYVDDNVAVTTNLSDYRPVVIALKDSATCYPDSFIIRPAVIPYFKSLKPRLDVYDARQYDGPDRRLDRHAYFHKEGYWFIFFIDKNSLNKAKWRYDTLIVQPDFITHGQK